ncbi:hypothetical protein SCATT_40410 [Streptantibioticus cattleyicolor NRRL 8057 = DSM 46488]|uniref:Uncharacterized protein n=1 Tax=Streptantibioticus cattleyicolor (strain ATCC 35852 / DSM 46488 / JCM 4925 / NBRC 14057 / NRRL 8057) TaxID=1003195 RepID=G8WXA1_STREN|nr:hypothetical protein SCATT_40410 [Streptantibioticus cattleyicolor NRRL 8057 = DSM 46488]
MRYGRGALFRMHGCVLPRLSVRPGAGVVGTGSLRFPRPFA